MAYSSNYDYDPDLPFFKQPKVLRGLYAIVLVSTLMTIFEMAFYRTVIDPETKDAAGVLVLAVKKKAYVMGRDMRASLPLGGAGVGSGVFLGGDFDLFDSYVETTRAREKEMVEKNNLYAYLTASFMLVILAVVLFVLHVRMREVDAGRHKLSVFGPNYAAAVKTSFLTVLLLASFQILFYFFGRQFKFVGTMGTEELVFAFNNYVRKFFGMPPVKEK